MKKTVAIFFMGIYMLSFSEFHQFLRIPVFVQHFFEHRQLNPKMSLLSFLKEHYIHQYVQDEDYQRDNQLPFRATDGYVVNANSLPSCDCPNQPVVAVVSGTNEVKNEFILYDEDDHSLLSIADIFQPPRCA